MSEKIVATWAGSGNGGAPNPELFHVGDVGADSAGVAAGLTYYIVGKPNSFSWLATGATVKNFHGGA